MSAKKPKFTWDKQTHAGYILLSDKPVASTKEMMSGLIVDLDSSGNIVGIEVI